MNTAIHSEDRVRLESLVQRAKQLLQDRSPFFTNGAKLAITDMIQEAERALRGECKLPFTRNRKFYQPRKEEAISFATERYTMVPTYIEEGKVYGRYGLAPALIWFEQQDMLYGGKKRLLKRAESVLKKSEMLLSQATFGTEVGQFDSTAADVLRQSMNEVEDRRDKLEHDPEGELLAQATVDCWNKLRAFRNTKVLRADVAPSAPLFLTHEELNQLKKRVQTDALLKQQYENIRRIANHWSLEEIKLANEFMVDEETDYVKWNRHFYLWSSTDKLINFMAPETAKRARLSFILQAEDNECDGLGHVWIDQVGILSASGVSITLRNGGFDEGKTMPDGWKPEVRKGNPLFKWEDQYPYCGGGDPKAIGRANPSSQVSFHNKDGIPRRSVYICNPTEQDEGAWTYDEDIPIEAGERYTLTFAAKIDGKLKRGLKTVITFLDEAGNVVGAFENWFNRKSSLSNGCFMLSMQCDAIEYAMSEDLTHAQKAKLEMLYQLHDFCQGAEHWMVKQSRPDGSDSYGAVQGGRLLSSTAVTYSLIKKANVFTEDEKSHFYAMIEYLLRYMLDLRDRTELTPKEAQQNCGNWQTDMCVGTAMMMLTMPDFPNRHAWLENANMVLNAQLQLGMNPDNSWPESIRYHRAVIERFSGYALALRKETGEDWFRSTGLIRMFSYMIDMQTPRYDYFDGRIGTPPFGDHALDGGFDFGCFGTYLNVVAEIDKSLADRMYHTWVLAGKPYKRLWGEAIALENLLGAGDNYVAEEPLQLTSTCSYPDAGIYIFRRHFGQQDESYFAIMSSPQRVRHGHLDQGSFILYKNRIPLVMDSGIEGYFDSSTNWHICSYSHACLQFATQKTDIPIQTSGFINLTAGTYSLERGWVDVPTSSKVIDCTLGDQINRITIEIANPEGEGRHIRQVTHLIEPDLYLIDDRIVGFQGNVLFNLPVAAKQAVIRDQRVSAEGWYGVDLDTIFLSNVTSIELEKGRSTPFFGKGAGLDDVSMMTYIRAQADAATGFLTLLHPKAGKEEMIVERPDENSIILKSGQRILKLAYDGQKWDYVHDDER